MSRPELGGALKALSQHGWFAERTPETQGIFAGIARLKMYQTGEALYLFGDPPNGIFGLVSGALDISIPRSDGLDLTAHRADPGFWIGDLALFSGQTRIVSVYAAEPTCVVHLPHGELQRLVRADPAFYEDFYALTHQNMATALRLLANLATSPSEARVGLRLLFHAESHAEPTDWLNLSQSKLAEMVALSVPTLQRILRRLQDAGLIELGYARIRVRDRHGLLELCSESGSSGQVVTFRRQSG